MPIAEGLVATKAAFEVSKIALDLCRYPKLDAGQVQAKLLELQSLILSAQFALGEALEENRSLKAQLDNREELRVVEADLEMDAVSRYLVRKSEKERGLIPYCPTCWASDSKLVPLAIWQHPGHFKCAIHSTSYFSPEQLEHHKRQNEIEKARAQSRRPSGSWMG